MLQLATEIANLKPTAEFYPKYLNLVLDALTAPAGALWMRTDSGNLKIQSQANMHQVGIDRNPLFRPMHDELLRYAMKGGPQIIPPGGEVPTESMKIRAGNPTDYVVLIAPLTAGEVVGLLEVWQHPQLAPDAHRGCLQLMLLMAPIASRCAYTVFSSRNQSAVSR